MDPYLRDLGKRIATLRKGLGLSRKELGAKIGSNHVTIGSIEDAETATRITILRKVAKGLNVSLGELVDPGFKKREISPKQALGALIGFLGEASAIKENETRLLLGALSDALEGEPEDEGDVEDEPDQSAK